MERGGGAGDMRGERERGYEGDPPQAEPLTRNPAGAGRALAALSKVLRRWAWREAGTTGLDLNLLPTAS